MPGEYEKSWIVTAWVCGPGGGVGLGVGVGGGVAVGVGVAVELGEGVGVGVGVRVGLGEGVRDELGVGIGVCADDVAGDTEADGVGEGTASCRLRLMTMTTPAIPMSATPMRIFLPMIFSFSVACRLSTVASNRFAAAYCAYDFLLAEIERTESPARPICTRHMDICRRAD